MATGYRRLADELVPFEAELWLRASPARRAAVLSRLATSLEAAGGTIGHETVIDEIDYHGVLGRAPAERLLQATRSGTVAWLATEGVRLFHATGQMAVPGEDDQERARGPNRLGATPTGRSRIAILDGFARAAHEALDVRLRVDDPENWSDTVSVASRNQGTLIASLVVHGDLRDAPDSLAEPVYLRPILRPEAPVWVTNAPEVLPLHRLPVDLVHEAVARLLEGDAASAPGTRVVVLAVGDPSQQFDRFISPLARLLDWLAWRYGLLFLVSRQSSGGPIRAGRPRPCRPRRARARGPRCATPRSTVPAAARPGRVAERTHDRRRARRRIPHPASARPSRPAARQRCPERAQPRGRRNQPRHQARHPAPGRPSADTPRADNRHRPPPPIGGHLPTTARPPRRRPRDRRRTRSLRPQHRHQPRDRTRRPRRRRHPEPARLAATSPRSGLPDDTLDPVLVKAALAHTARWGTAAPRISDLLGDAGEDRSRARIGLFLGHGRAPRAGSHRRRSPRCSHPGRA